MQTIISSRDFNRDASALKKKAKLGAVIITDRGKPSHVLLSIEEYNKILGHSQSIGQLLAMDGDFIDFEPAVLSDKLLKPVKF